MVEAAASVFALVGLLAEEPMEVAPLSESKVEAMLVIGLPLPWTGPTQTPLPYPGLT